MTDDDAEVRELLRLILEELRALRAAVEREDEPQPPATVAASWPTSTADLSR
jgi:hypothetical protein